MPVACLLGAVVMVYHLITTFLHGPIEGRKLVGLPPDPDPHGVRRDRYGRRVHSTRGLDLIAVLVLLPAALWVAVPDLLTRGTRATAIAGVAALVAVVGLWRVVAAQRSEAPPPLATLGGCAVALLAGLAPFGVVDATNVERPWEFSLAWMRTGAAYQGWRHSAGTGCSVGRDARSARSFRASCAGEPVHTPVPARQRCM